MPSSPKLCPACNLPAKGHGFAFECTGNIAAITCRQCVDRLGKLPAKAGERWLSIADRRCNDQTDKYTCKRFESADQAKMAIALSVDPATHHGIVAMLLGAA